MNNRRRMFKLFLNNLKFKFENLSIPNQITIFWSVIWMISLFLPWIVSEEKNITWNAFNSISWNVWFILIIIFFLPVFLILSNSYKEKIKLYSDINFKSHFIIINSWFVSISFSIIALSFAVWLSTIWEKIRYWNWPILGMTAWILILIGWLYIRKQFKTSNSEIILEKLNQEREMVKEKNNMKLPF